MMCRKPIFLPVLALVLAVSAFLIPVPRVFASTGASDGEAAALADTPAQSMVVTAETLTVDDVWLTGDTLHIAVTDKANGDSQTLALNLSDYAKATDEYVTIQATDTSGRVSNAIQFKNPYYAPLEEPTDNGGIPADAAAERPDTTESSVSENDSANDGKPFTPDGTGSVVDNATDGDGKEFFTVETPDGNMFYLIVDRQRNADNVYLLNAVTENDLASLAKPGSSANASAIATPVPTAAPVQPEVTPTPEPTPEPQKNGGNMGMLGVLAAVLILVGGVGYYFKIVRPKQDGYDDYEAEENTEPGEDYDEPGVEAPTRYDTDEDERMAEEREVGGE